MKGFISNQKKPAEEPLLQDKEVKPTKEKTPNTFFAQQIHGAKKKKIEDLEDKVTKAQDEYHPLNIPPDWNFARRHAEARATAPEIGDDNVVQEVCPCCGYEINRKQLDWKKDGVDALDYLGSGFPMFYTYIRYCILLLCVLFVVENLLGAITNFSGTFCTNGSDSDPDRFKHGNACVDDWILQSSMANIKDKPEIIYWRNWFCSLTVVLVMIILVFFRRRQKLIHNRCDEQMKTVGDFSILVKNIPKHSKKDKQPFTGKYIKEQLKERFEKATKESVDTNTKLNIKKITLVYDIDKLEHIEHHISQIVQEKQKFLRDHNFEYIYEAIYDKQVKHLDEEIEKLEHEAEHLCDKEDLPFAGWAFITYNTKRERIQVVEENGISQTHRIKAHFNDGQSHIDSHDNQNIYFEDRHMYVEEAPEANEIDWEFVHLHTKHRIWERTKCFGKTFWLAGCCYIIIYLLSYFKSSLIDKAFEEKMEGLPGADKTYIDAWIISYVIAAFIILFNKFCLGYLCHQITDGEKWSTKTKLNISFAQKLTILLFLNTAVMTFAVEILTFNNYYGVGGMLYTEYIIFCLNGVVPPMAWIVDPWSMLKRYQRYKELKKKNSCLTQQEANVLMERTSYTMGKRYADIMKTMWFTFLYSPALPLATPWSILGLSIYYFADKHNVIARRTIKESIGMGLSIEMIELLEYIILFHCFGNVWFNLQMFDKNIDIPNIVLFVVGVAYIILPIQDWTDWAFDIKTVEETETYDEVEVDLDTDYDRENPVTRRKALMAWYKLRHKKSEDIDHKKHEEFISKAESNLKQTNVFGGVDFSMIKSDKQEQKEKNQLKIN